MTTFHEVRNMEVKTQTKFNDFILKIDMKLIGNSATVLIKKLILIFITF